MTAQRRPWTENDETGPENSKERRGILSFIDDRIAALHRKAKRPQSGENTRYAAQVLEALRGDLRQELDREESTT
ncbi:hypothetical protein [Sphingopyxis sp. BE249]|uniref:hypothetical protein n=1 Tax=Sphingopyxis sp. BE249 TaxID=2817719 RepID=UPI00286A4A8B|nr:hypothetical protein [Sphingopyxis sp. BE249]